MTCSLCGGYHSDVCPECKRMEKSKMMREETIDKAKCNIHGSVNVVDLIDTFPIRLGKFTKITMENGNYMQGNLKAIFQEQD